MSVQVIINTAQNIEIDRRKVVGQTISRSQRLRVAERYTSQPFVLTVTPLARFPYRAVRGIIETIQTPDRSQEQQIYLSQNTNLSYINDTLNDCYNTSPLNNNYYINTFTNTTCVLTATYNSTLMTPIGQYLLRAGDWIQPSNSRYPYIVAADVLSSSATQNSSSPYSASNTLLTFTATTHRPLITSEGIDPRTTIYMGTATSMRVVVSQLPTYKLVERDQAEYTGDFILVEKII